MPAPEQPAAADRHIEDFLQRQAAAARNLLGGLHVVAAHIQVAVAVGNNRAAVFSVCVHQLRLSLNHQHDGDAAGADGGNHPREILHDDIRGKIVQNEPHIHRKAIAPLPQVRDAAEFIHRLGEEQIRDAVHGAVCVGDDDEESRLFVSDAADVGLIPAHHLPELICVERADLIQHGRQRTVAGPGGCDPKLPVLALRKAAGRQEQPVQPVLPVFVRLGHIQF